jgi:tRNA dimethylallyltransferase
MGPAYGVSPEPMSRDSRQSPGRIPLIVVAGPTASGKSALAIRIAEDVGGVVINADSMQVYRELEILTARPGQADVDRAPHRLYGFRGLDDPCSAAVWRALAVTAITEVCAAGQVPILCGGTGFYIRALLEGIAPIPEIPKAVRAAARELHGNLGGAAFRARLAQRDPVMAARLADGDGQRLVRAFEVMEATDRSLCEWQADDLDSVSDFDALTIVLMPERPPLYGACDERFYEMMRRGALAEADAVAALDLDSTLPGMKALGLPELLSYLHGEISMETAIELAQRATRRYAKRQKTWFRHQIIPNIELFAQFSESMEAEIFPKIRQFLLTHSG